MKRGKKMELTSQMPTQARPKKYSTLENGLSQTTGPYKTLNLTTASLLLSEVIRTTNLTSRGRLNV